MIKKWKTAFFVSLAINILIIVGTGFIILMNTLASGHSYDNQLVIAEDLDNISKAIQQKAYTIKEFDKELTKINAGHNTDNVSNFIRLQIAHILFDDHGNFDKIETYYLTYETE